MCIQRQPTVDRHHIRGIDDNPVYAQKGLSSSRPRWPVEDVPVDLVLCNWCLECASTASLDSRTSQMAWLGSGRQGFGQAPAVQRRVLAR